MVNFVGVESKMKETKLANLLKIGIFLGFVWILFHFTIVFFFGLMLESIMLVGIFLALGNAAALLMDIPTGVLQKYIKPKTFIFIATLSLFISCLIFLKFIYFEGIATIFLPNSPNSGLAKGATYLGLFFDDTLNIVLLAVAAMIYGVTKECFDITMLSYIFNKTTPSEYAKYISKYNIHFGVGSFVGLIFSGVLLSLNIKIAILIFLFLVFIFFLFVLKFFDNGKDSFSINMKGLKKIKIDSFKLGLGKQSGKISQSISTNSLMKVMDKTKVIFLKPVEIKESIDFNEVVKTTKEAFVKFYEMITWKPSSLVLMWIISLVMWFSFWDTFVATFLVEFLQDLVISNKNEPILQQTGGLITGYVLLGVLVIPAYLAQDPFIKLSKKFGQFNIMMFGSIVSALSLIAFFIFADNLYMIVALGMINSVGYAAVFPICQAVFSERYNILYAERNNLKQIDSSSSAAPLMIVLNLANVVGLALGALVLMVFGHKLFFFLFGGLLLAIFVFSIINYKKINHSDDEADKNFSDSPKIETFDGEII